MSKVYYHIRNSIIIQIIVFIVCNILLFNSFMGGENFFEDLLRLVAGIPLGFVDLFKFQQLKLILWIFLLLTIPVTILFFKKQNKVTVFLFYLFYNVIWSCPGYFLFFFLTFSMPGNGSGIY